MQKITTSHSITSYQGFSTGREKGMGTIMMYWASLLRDAQVCQRAHPSLVQSRLWGGCFTNSAQTLRKIARPVLMKQRRRHSSKEANKPLWLDASSVQRLLKPLSTLPQMNSSSIGRKRAINSRMKNFWNESWSHVQQGLRIMVSQTKLILCPSILLHFLPPTSNSSISTHKISHPGTSALPTRSPVPRTQVVIKPCHLHLLGIPSMSPFLSLPHHLTSRAKLKGPFSIT